ncbi:MAG TPA: HAMP domain-containing sensor histidine kinase [Actinomycetota bacterium]|nr:HAMP domain-containing sensor histidine kinase [Actinomycetota bacterium]
MPIATGRFRWRLTVAFIVVSGVSAGVLALGSYFLVNRARNETFLDRSLRDAQISYAIARTELGKPDPDGLRSLLFSLERQTGAGIIMVTADGTISSDPDLDLETVPQDFRSPPESVEGPDLAYSEMTRNDTDYLVVTSVGALDELDLYLLYSRESLQRSMGDLAEIMVRLWAAVVAASALVGTALARRTLSPVAHASQAARLLAEGLLDTRLPVEREDEFGAWAVSFNEMADALQDKIDQLTRAREREQRFTSDVAHELRTPLTALVSSASMLDAQLARMDPEARWAADKMIAEVRRLRSLVEELMEISKLHAGRESVRMEPVDLSHLIRHVVSTRKWGDAVDVDGERLDVITDRRRVERIVANLVSNALIHGKKGVRAETKRDNGSALIHVTDQGPGIPPEHLDNVFDRFYKADPSRSGGSGLGLSIAWENATLLGGTIRVESEPGRGASFTVVLPLEEVHASKPSFRRGRGRRV